jgi:hypothetical protein
MQKDAVAREVDVLKNIANVFKQEFLVIQIASVLIARISKAVKKEEIYLSIKQN